MTLDNKVNIAGQLCPCIIPAVLRKGFDYSRITYEVYIPIMDSYSQHYCKGQAERINDGLRMILDGFTILQSCSTWCYIGNGYWYLELMQGRVIDLVSDIVNQYSGCWIISHPFAHFRTDKREWEG